MTLLILLYVLVALISILLIGIILIQPSKSGGMGSAFGGIGESVFGAQVGSHLTKATVIMTAVFFIVVLALASLIGHGWRSGGVDHLTRQLTETREEAPALSAAAGEEAPVGALTEAPAGAVQD